MVCAPHASEYGSARPTMNHDNTSVDMTCPHHAQHRTIRVGVTELYCVDCDISWSPFQPAARAQTQEQPEFTQAELRRLRAYQLAVRRGFYSDWRADPVVDDDAEFWHAVHMRFDRG